MATFRNPANDHIETVDLTTIAMGTLFGPFYYAAIHAWGVAFISLIAGPVFIGTLSLLLIGVMLGGVPDPRLGIPYLPGKSFLLLIILPLGASAVWASLMQPLVRRSFLLRGWQPLD